EESVSQGSVEVTVQPGAAHCLALTPKPRGLAGDAYRQARARADWALAAAGRVRGLDVVENPPSWDLWLGFAASVAADPAKVLAKTLQVDDGGYQPVVHWGRAERNKVTLIPSDHWLLLHDEVPFRAQLHGAGSAPIETACSVPVADGHVACFPPRHPALPREGVLHLERYDGDERSVRAPLRFLAPNPEMPPNQWRPDSVALLTNGRGAMSRLRLDLGSVRSKYDCVLGANLHPQVPVDRHVWIKRLRAWINADGFVTALNFDNLLNFEPGPPAHWRFLANAGDGRSVEVHLVADLLDQENSVVLQFIRPLRHPGESRLGRPLEPSARVTLTVRLDLEDRNFHSQTKYNDGANQHFTRHCRPVVLGAIPAASGSLPFDGFEFTPATDRRLRVWTTMGAYHHEPEWTLNIAHPVEASRGQELSGDAFSPGWFEIPLTSGDSVTLVASAEAELPTRKLVAGFGAARSTALNTALERAGAVQSDDLTRRLVRSLQAFVVRRDDTRSVIAGYPWFLDWGRDSLIAARGLIAAGLHEEVRDLLITFGRFENAGTLPNSIHGNDASNRDTTDAPLWFGIVCEELAADSPSLSSLYATQVDTQRNLTDVLRSIACGYLQGTPNGIRVDHPSGLVWSPAHFTWMDTNYPAGTPREGYPIEIQALWIRLLRQLAKLGADPWEGGPGWIDLSQRAEESFHRYFWLEQLGWYSDVLLATSGTPAERATPSNALRSNCLLAVSLDIDRHPEAVVRARRAISASARYLVVPGALRSLAPRSVTPPLPIHASNGSLLNDPIHPYWPRYEGDEDTRRKPAYHNGTAWTWTFPAFCEALVKAYPGDSRAQAAARSYLGSVDQLLTSGCLGHLPEITDGDAPHTPRGCDAQAWSVTEVLRVWMALHRQKADDPQASVDPPR
ncbi:MAG TPA: amylo-alpha-1,6-glucosidase, partial [Verrucomicrobiota bacterium]|nr:amylo-alpha-1,6-glucosidase [Verrucomicrobiales bacterium]HRI16804.1 amylo-alpha-1,6-glucosidase [Verrucomicrobiota bacterium]